jgi:hypothetical protein
MPTRARPRCCLVADAAGQARLNMDVDRAGSRLSPPSTIGVSSDHSGEFSGQLTSHLWCRSSRQPLLHRRRPRGLHQGASLTPRCRPRSRLHGRLLLGVALAVASTDASPSQSPPRTPPRLPRLVHRGVPSCELQLQRRSASKCPVAATSSSRCLHGQSGTDFPQRPMSLSRPGRTTSRPFASRPTATDCPCKARSAGVARRTTKRSPSETTA